MKKIILSIILALVVLSCQNITKKENAIETSSAKNINNNEYDETEDELDDDFLDVPDSEVVYPKTGSKAEDFLPVSGIFEIQFETSGDLNNDGLNDIAIVLVQKEIKTATRPMLVLLQNKDKTYRLDKVSNTVMPIEYNDSDYKIYDTEDINIENGTLNIRLYGTGPSGNIFSDFKYFDNDLILIYIETYNSGAGSWSQLYYDLEKAEITQVVTNTMEESTPTEEKTLKLPKKIYKFENASPGDIIIETYKIVDIEW